MEKMPCEGIPFQTGPPSTTLLKKDDLEGQILVSQDITEKRMREIDNVASPWMITDMIC